MRKSDVWTAELECMAAAIAAFSETIGERFSMGAGSRTVEAAAETLKMALAWQVEMAALSPAPTSSRGWAEPPRSRLPRAARPGNAPPPILRAEIGRAHV